MDWDQAEGHLRDAEKTLQMLQRDALFLQRSGQKADIYNKDIERVINRIEHLRYYLERGYVWRF